MLRNDKLSDHWLFLNMISDGNCWKSRMQDQYDFQSEESGAHVLLTVGPLSHYMIMTLVKEHQIKISCGHLHIGVIQHVQSYSKTVVKPTKINILFLILPSSFPPSSFLSSIIPFFFFPNKYLMITD